MENILIYIVQVNILLGLIYLGYVFLLKGLTFYRLNRVYFLAGTLYAVVFPFIDLSVILRQKMSLHVPVVLDYISFEIVEEPVNRFTLATLLFAIVVVVGAVLLLKLLIRLLSLGRIHFYSKPSQWQHYLFRNVLFPIVPFSFFNKIYVHRAQHEELELHDIFKHEDIHVKGLHTVDILWFEMLLIGCWYNPFVWLMRKAVRQNLEFLTDQQVLDKGIDRQTYQYSLLHVTQRGAVVSISNHFNFKSLKKRIMMMNKKRSSKLELSKYAFLLPILILTGASFTLSKAERKIEEVVQKAENIALDVMLPHKNANEQKKVDAAETEREKNEIVQDTVKKPMIQLLQGKVSGVNIGRTDTVGKQEITVRGIPQNVLIVMDGEQKPKGFTLHSIDPNDIHSMTILKDQATIPLYGDEAKDGVIVITTKDYVAKKKKEGILITGTSVGLPLSDSTGTTNIRIRGANNNFVTPLYILGGKEVSDDILKKLDPNDIESIEVLKNKSALEKYGEKGKNGVIIISLKVGKSEKYKVLEEGGRIWEPQSYKAEIDPVTIVGYRSESKGKISSLNSLDSAPEPEGGMQNFRKWIADNFSYPKGAIDAGVKGTVLLTFIVKSDGSLNDIKLLRDIGYGTGQAALNLMFKSPKWKPGTKNGKEVDVQYTFPIKLDLTTI